MNYKEVLAFIFDQLPMFSKIGTKALHPSLDKIIQLCEVIGHPEQKFKSIHIAGTNGKGSTSHILSACFQAAGYKTGLYTSPHLVDLRERIRINGQLVSEANVATFINDYWEAIQNIKPSYFELNVAMAFWAFAKEGVDIAIIETGLGGRWDSTNIITPELSIITNISLDHTNVLGTTLPEIAGEKAGIIKKGIPVVIGSSQTETGPVFSKYAVLNQTQLTYADIMFEGAVSKTNTTTQLLKVVDTRNYSIHDIETDLLGAFQIENIKTALAAVIILEQKGWNLNFDIFKSAVKQVKQLTGLRGRWDIIQNEPLTIADVGHNPSGVSEIAKQLEHPNLKNKHKHIIIGFVADKDVKEALSLLPKGNTTYYFTQAQIPRALPYEQLHTFGEALMLNGNSYKNVASAIDQALKNHNTDDLILITGSFFIVGEALEYFDSKQQKNKL